jgi:hypothetical protein
MIRDDGAAGRRSEQAILLVQPRRADSGVSSSASHQSDCYARVGRSSREAATLLQRDRATLDRSRAHDEDAHGRRQTRAVAEFLSGLDDEDLNEDRKLPKVISPTDPCSAWTAKANKRVQFGRIQNMKEAPVRETLRRSAA